MLRPVNPPGGEPPTGEPYAGDPHVRFGGGSDRGNNRPFLPLSEGGFYHSLWRSSRWELVSKSHVGRILG
jgi:hypothetical protein